MKPTISSLDAGCPVQVSGTILDSSVGLWAGIQSAGERVPKTPGSESWPVEGNLSTSNSKSLPYVHAQYQLNNKYAIDAWCKQKLLISSDIILCVRGNNNAFYHPVTGGLQGRSFETNFCPPRPCSHRLLHSHRPVGYKTVSKLWDMRLPISCCYWWCDWLIKI